MFKRMLVPLDGSALSAEVLPIAKELLEAGIEEVTLFRVGEIPHGTGRRRIGLMRRLPLTPFAGAPAVFSATTIASAATAPEYAETKSQAIEREEHELLEYLQRVGQALTQTGQAIHVAVHLGEPASEIIDLASEGAFDLILMATHGRSGFRETLHESVTAAVIRSGVAPVLVVRPLRPARSKRSRPSDLTRDTTDFQGR